MKTLLPILLLVLLGGCSKPSTPQVAAPSNEHATILARQVANAQADTLYKVRPFVDGPPALWTNGHWVWKDRRGLGNSDIEAVVYLGPDFSTQSVRVLVLDSRPTLSFPDRRAPTPMQEP